jgi:putative membrane protein
MLAEFSPAALNTALQAYISGFPDMMAQGFVTLVMVAIGAAVYARLTPHNEMALIRAGNTAAALSFSAVILGLAIPMAASLAASQSVPEVVLWGLTTLLLQLLAFSLVDLLLRDLPRRIREGEMSAAILLASVKLGAALVLAAAVSG